MTIVKRDKRNRKQNERVDYISYILHIYICIFPYFIGYIYI